MLVFMIVAAVLIGLAYADYCLVDNTEHFGLSLGRVDRDGKDRFTRLEVGVERAGVERAGLEERPRAENPPARPSPRPAAKSPAVKTGKPPTVDAAWLLLELGPILELREDAR